jgi:hypothetical protein
LPAWLRWGLFPKKTIAPAVAAVSEHFFHEADRGPLDAGSVCAACGQLVEPLDVIVVPGPGLKPSTADSDVVTKALSESHRLLTAVS